MELKKIQALIGQNVSAQALREAKADLAAELRAAADAGDNARFEVADAVFRQLEPQLRQRERLEQLDSERAVSANTGGDKWAAFGQAARSLVGMSADLRSITTGNGSATIQDPSVTDLIVNELVAQPFFTESGLQVESDENYKAWPVVEAGPAPSWLEEEDELTGATLTISSAKREYKYLGVLVKVTNQWLRDSGDRGTRLVQDAIMAQMSDAIAKAVLHGTGADGQPSSFDSTTTLEVDAGEGILQTHLRRVQAVRMLMQNHVPVNRISHIFGPESWQQMALMADLNGQPLQVPAQLGGVRSVAFSGMKEDFPFDPQTDPASFTTREYLFDRDSVVLGLGPQWQMRLVEKFATTMQTAFMVVAPIDLTILRPDAVCKIKNIGLWGNPVIT